MASVAYNGFLPFCIPTHDEERNTFSRWDGSTLYNNRPSKKSTKTVTVYGSGSDYCIQLTRAQVAEMWWRMRKFKTDASFLSTPICSLNGTGRGLYGTTAESVSYGIGAAPEIGYLKSVTLTPQSSGPDIPSPGRSLIANIETAKVVSGFGSGTPTLCDEKWLTCPLAGAIVRTQVQDYKDGSVDNDYFAGFITGSQVNGSRSSTHNVASVVISGFTSNFGLAPEGVSVASPANIPVLNINPYFPNFDFIQVGDDEFWWAPRVPINASLFLGIVASGTASSASLQFGSYTGAVSSDTGSQIVSIPITLTFSDGTSVTGNQFLLQATYYQTPSGRVAGTSHSLTVGSSSTACQVTGSITPSALLPTGISLTCVEWFGYSGRWNISSGALL